MLSSNLASKGPPRVPPTPQNHAPVYTRTQIQQIAFCALQVLLGCFLAALGASLDAFWAPLGGSLAPLGLNLGSLGRLWASSWGLLGASWAPLGPLGRLLGQLGALWAPHGLQMDTNWTPSERQVGLPQQLQISTHSLRTSQQLPNPTDHLANSTFCRRMATLCNTSTYISKDFPGGALSPQTHPGTYLIHIY